MKDREKTSESAKIWENSRIWVALSVVVGIVMTIWAAMYYKHRADEIPTSLGQGLPLDDAWIHAQFALNVSEGHFFQFEPGALSSGSTSPLWSILYGFGLFLVGDPVLAGHGLGILFTIAMMVMAIFLGRRLGLENVSLLAIPILLACQWRLAWASVSGMEIPLVSFLVLLMFWVYLREKQKGSLPFLSGALAGLLLWSRPEGLIGILVLCFDQILTLFLQRRDGEKKKIVLKNSYGLLAGWFCVALPYFIMNYVSGPGVFPQTVYAKTHDVPLSFTWNVFWEYFFRLSDPNWVWYLFFIGAVGYAMIKFLTFVRSESEKTIIVLFVLIYFFIVAFGRGLTDYHDRYIFPVLPLLIVFGVYGLSQIAHRMWLKISITTLSVFALSFTAYSSVVEWAEGYALNVSSVTGHVVRMGQWINENLPEDDTISMSDIGAMGYFTKNHIVDMRGLISPYHGWDRLDELDRLKRERVSYAILFPELNERVIRRGQFVPVYAITLEANNISATDHLVVYRTPWMDRRTLSKVGTSFDFEDGTLQGWTSDSDVLQRPVQTDRRGHQHRSFINIGGGTYFLSSRGEKGDHDQGKALSPTFLIEGDVMKILVGGGQYSQKLGVHLLINGKAVRRAAGCKSGVLIQKEWDIREFQGQKAQIEIFDSDQGRWGFMMVDEIHQYRVLSGDAPDVI